MTHKKISTAEFGEAIVEEGITLAKDPTGLLLFHFLKERFVPHFVVTQGFTIYDVI